MSTTIKIDKEFRTAFDAMENSKEHLFITGKAGTGKSTLLRYFRYKTKKKIAVLSPTGVSAINVNGQTIHSFFNFGYGVTADEIKRVSKKKRSLYEKLDAIVIDEISMVRSDLLDCVDQFLRLNGKDRGVAFGGLQMIFIGDLFQLPPVVMREERELFKYEYKSEYFFDAKVFEEKQATVKFIELNKIHRQQNTKFISLLNSIRNNTITSEELDVINKQFNPKFKPTAKNLTLYLTPTNKAAQEINDKQLAKLKKETISYEGQIKDDFELKSLPTEKNLNLKIGAQVMLLNNDQHKRWVNGSLGKIVSIDEGDFGDDVISIKLNTGKTVSVEPHTWENSQLLHNVAKKKIEREVVGSFKQYPLKLAWAVTIHKSQGKTFDNVIIDIGNGTFAHGQMYVALTRCRTLKGITLLTKIAKKHILVDYKVSNFFKACS